MGLEKSGIFRSQIDRLTHPELAGIVYALSEPPRGTTPPAGTATNLTKREWQVADLVAKGLTNRAIAASLVISDRTAQGHVEHILTKLGFTSRAQIAAWFVDQTRREEL